MKKRYFVCNKSFIHYPKELPSQTINSFINSVAWGTTRSYYSYSSSCSNSTTSSYYELPQYDYWEFSAGLIYQQIVYRDNEGYIHDNHGRCINIVKEKIDDYFIEIKPDIDEKLQSCIDTLEKKGFKVTIEPSSCIIDYETNNVTLVTYMVRLTNKELVNCFWHYDTCLATDIYTGLCMAMRSFKRHSTSVESLENALKGEYLAYAQKKYAEKLKKENAFVI